MKGVIKNKSQAFKIGMATLISIFLFFFGINFLKGSKLFEKTDRYYMILPNSGGLQPSSQVVINGFKVGKVSKIDFDYSGLGDIIVELEVNKDLELPRGTIGMVATSVMGGSSVQLSIPTDRTQGLIEKGGTIASTPSSADLVATVQGKIIPNVAKVTQQLDTLLSGLNRIVNAPQIPLTLESISSSARSLQTTTAQLNTLMNQHIPTIVDNIEVSSASISDVTQKINKIEFEAILQDFANVVNELRTVSVQLNSKDNSLGLLLNDPVLYNQLTQASKSADSLLVDIRANPKRYVRLSLF